MYPVRIPFFIPLLYPQIRWSMPDKQAVYLSFDDGPHPELTPWVLGQLKAFGAKATFFVLGSNAEKYPDLVKSIREEGHAIGHHSWSHLNGWETEDEPYIEDVERAAAITGSPLFRPPYGKIKRSQLARLATKYTIVNWSLMPGDFDVSISPETCYERLSKNIRGGDIVCLHDSEKARKHLEYCLPRWLELIKRKGLRAEALSL